jgi:hypothetical protein
MDREAHVTENGCVVERDRDVFELHRWRF